MPSTSSKKKSTEQLQDKTKQELLTAFVLFFCRLYTNIKEKKCTLFDIHKIANDIISKHKELFHSYVCVLVAFNEWGRMPPNRIAYLGKLFSELVELNTKDSLEILMFLNKSETITEIETELIHVNKVLQLVELLINIIQGSKGFEVPYFDEIRKSVHDNLSISQICEKITAENEEGSEKTNPSNHSLKIEIEVETPNKSVDNTTLGKAKTLLTQAKRPRGPKGRKLPSMKFKKENPTLNVKPAIPIIKEGAILEKIESTSPKTDSESKKRRGEELDSNPSEEGENKDKGLDQVCFKRLKPSRFSVKYHCIVQ